MNKRKRTTKAVEAEYQKLWDKVWWRRHYEQPEPGNKYWQQGEQVARGLTDRYGRYFLEEGALDVCVERMRALAWVLGAEWDEGGDT